MITDRKLMSKKKPTFPINEMFDDYLKKYKRNTKISIVYDDLLRFQGSVTVFDKNDEIIGEYKASANGSFTVILQPGTYSLEIESPGYKLGTQTLKVSEFDSNKGMNMKTFTLSK